MPKEPSLQEGEEERKRGSRHLKETYYASKETEYTLKKKKSENLRERRVPCHRASHPESAEVIAEEVAARVGNLRGCDFRGVCVGVWGGAALSRSSRAFVRIARAFINIIIQQKTSLRGHRQRHA